MRMFQAAVFSMVLLVGCRSGGAGSEAKDLADGSNWCHARFKSTDQTAISVDYNIASDDGTTRARPVWINLQRAGLSGAESVRVVIVEKSYDTQAGPSQQTQGQTFQHDMSFDAAQKKFTVEVPNGLVTLAANGDTSQRGYVHEFAFVVDGAWLKDPVSGGSNFKANLYRIHADNGHTCSAN